MKSKEQKRKDAKRRMQEYITRMHDNGFRMMCRWVHEDDWKAAGKYLTKKRKMREKDMMVF